MNEARSYGVRGSTVLAYAIEDRSREHGRGVLIDYDVARRSYEARRRLSERRDRSGKAMAPVLREGFEQLKRPRQTHLQEVLMESYRPERGVSQAIRESCHSLVHSIATHPFVDELRNGTLKGKVTPRATRGQVLVSGSICMALSALLMFVGA